MRRRTLIAGFAAVSCGRDRRPRLNVYNWSDYVAPTTIPDFERERGVRVRYGLYESAEEMLAKVMTGNSGWDVVFPPSNYIRPMREMGLLARFDRERLTNLGNLDPPFDAPPWDAHLEWSVPYMWGATGIVHRSDMPVTGWADLWDGRLAGRVTMLDDPVEVFGACLKKLGYSLNSGVPGELIAARAEAVRQKRLLRAYVNQEVRDQLLAGEVHAAQCWRDLAGRVMEAAPGKLAFCYPREGYALYADNAVILRESKRTDLAHAFVDYLLRAPVAAAVSRAVHSSTVNRAARALLPSAIRDSPLFFPDAETMARGEWLVPLSAPAQRLRDRLWTEVKSA